MPHDADSEFLIAQLAALESGETLAGGSDAERVAKLHADLAALAARLPPLRDVPPQQLEPTTRQLIDRVRRLPDEATWNSATLDTSPAQSRGVLSAPPVRQLGQYVLGARLGAGGMGAVYKARHQKLERDVALKLLPAEQLHDSQVRARFEREMKAVGQLKHPNIVAAADAGEADGIPYLVMELVDGEDLNSISTRWGKLPVPLACAIIRQAAQGLQHAWQRGLIHRDIKPANLMLAREGEQAVVKILDLGLALLQESQAADQGNLTSDGQVMGTIEFMAPEQASDTHGVSIAADIYSLGATLFKLLTGQSPLAAAGRTTILAKLRALADEDLSAAVVPSAGLPPELTALLTRMLARDPAQRPVSPGEVAAALLPLTVGADLGLLFGERTSAATGGEPAPTTAGRGAASRTSPPRRVNLKWLAGAAALVLLLGVIVFKITRGDGRTMEVVVPDDVTKLEVVTGAPQPTSGWRGWPTDAPRPALAPFDAAQAKRHQEAWAAYLQTPVEYTNSVGMKFVLIPPGEFSMGSTAEEVAQALQLIDPNDTHWQACIRSEAPRHTAILTKPIYLGTTEVTQAQYEAVMGTNPSHFSISGPGKDRMAGLEAADHPVEMASWNDAAGFCVKLSQREGLQPFYSGVGETITPLDGTGYRLPSEAEWEFACRAGTTTKYWIGDTDADLVRAGWFGGNSGGRTHMAGELQPNPFGLHDMHGNVWEWVQDGWDAAYYGQFQEQPAIDPHRPFSAETRRVVRGGDWITTASSCRPTYRYADDPSARYRNFGFRVALAAVGPSASTTLSPSRTPSVSAAPTAAQPAWSLYRRGDLVRRFKTLEALREQVRDGDVIEIGPNAETDLKPPFFGDRRVRIRGVEGHRPTLYFVGVWEQRADLTLDGVDLMAVGPSELRCHATLTLRHCRLQLADVRMLAPGTALTADTSLLLVSSVAISSGVNVKLENCIGSLRSPMLIGGPGGQAIEIRRSTLLVGDQQTYLLAAAADVDQPVTVSASRNLICYNFADGLGKPFGPYPLQQAAVFRWDGERNVYAPKVAVEFADEGRAAVRTMADWQARTGAVDRGSLEAPRPWFEMSSQHASETAQEYFAQIQQKITAAATKLPGVGPRWDRIGPGTAWEQLRGDAAAAAADTVATKNPFRLVHGQTVRGWAILDEAIAAAVDGDIIDIATNEPQASLALTAMSADGQRGRRVTLRAAHGFTPTVRGILIQGNDRLALEGLTIRGRIEYWPHDHWKETLVNGPRVTRISHCLVVEGATRTPLSPHLGYQSTLLPIGPEEGAVEIVGTVFDGGVQLVPAEPTTVRISDSVLPAIGMTPTGADGCKLEFDHASLWLPEPQPACFSPFAVPESVEVAVRSTLIESGGNLWLNDQPPLRWQGDDNLIRNSSSRWFSTSEELVGVSNFAALRQRWTSDGRSSADVASIWSPHAWDLVADSPAVAALAKTGAGAQTPGDILHGATRRVDLLATFDPVKSTTDGAFPQNSQYWRSTPEGLRFTSAASGVVRFPVALRDRSYRLDLEFTRHAGTRVFNLDLPMSTGLYTIAVAEGDPPSRTGLARSGQATRSFQVQSGRRYRLSVTVQMGAEGHVSLEVDGESLLVDNGDPLGHVIPRDTSFEQFNYLGVYLPSAEMDISLHSARVQFLD